jgi:iron complex transport system substrate-binding protein
VRAKKIGLSVLLFILLAPFPAWLGGSQPDDPAASRQNLRVITCSKAHFLILDALYMFPEAAESVVAFGRNAQVGGSFISLLDPRAAERAVLAPDPGVEEILALEPDTVVLKSYLKGELGHRLEELNVSVLYLDLENPEQFHRDIAAIGELFGNPERAEALNRYFAEGFQAIVSLTREIPEADKPGILLLFYNMRSGTASFNVPPKQWLQTSLVRWAGGNPVWFETAAGSGWQQISFEQIAAWDPDKILLVSYHTPVDEAKATLLADPKWLELEAVRRDGLLAFPADFLSWDQPDPRWILGLYWLASKLHPQLLPSEEVEKKVGEFYGFVYGLPEELIRREILPIIRGDYP